MTDDAWMIKLAGGFTIACPPNLDTLSTYVFKEQEDWFEDEAAFVRRLATPGMRMIDIGANLGFYALSAAAAAGGDADILAIEPTPEVAALLRRSIAANRFSRIEVAELAVGDRNGTIALHRNGSNELNSIGTGDVPGDVVLRRLDDVVAAHGIETCDVLKIDVEGAESRVVAGAARFLASASPLIMFEIRDGERTTLDAADLLRDAGYALYELAVDPPMLVPFSGRLDAMRLNLFACKPDRAETLEARGLLAPGFALVAPADHPGIAALILRAAMLAPRSEAIARAIAEISEDDPFSMALGWYAAAEMRGCPPNRRAGALRLAHAAAQTAVAAQPDIPRLCAAARIARAAGARAKAAQAARAVHDALRAGVDVAADMPLLAMLPSYESWTAPGGVRDWLDAMALEATWRWSAFSDMFTPESALSEGRAARLRELGRELPDLERRWRLAARRAHLSADG